MATHHYLDGFYQNVRGLRTKAIQFLDNASVSEFSFIALTETWLNSTHQTCQYFPSNYEVHRRDRDYNTTGQTRGGGILLALNKHHYPVSSRKYHLESKEIEAIWIETQVSKHSKILMGVIYLPPTLEDVLITTRNRKQFGKIQPSNLFNWRFQYSQNYLGFGFWGKNTPRS